MNESHYEHKAIAYGMGHTRRDRILSLAQGAGRRVLDVGCARGYLGKIIRDRGNWVGGVELSHEAANIARTNLDEVWSFDIQQPWPQQLLDEPFDLIILGEVVEHLFDPVQVLRNLRGALRPGGLIIITTPNFMTWTNRLRFLIGKFRYQEQGMFDFGHIRWFTYSYLKEVLAEAGFQIEGERHIIFPGKLTWLLKSIPSLFAWQFIVKAKAL